MKAQSWSLDLIIAVVIFIVVMTLFYTLLVREPKADIAALKREGKYISEKITTQAGTGPCAFLDNKYVDVNKIKECFDSGTDENSVRERFRKENNLKGEFCIYIIDQNGRLITINNMTGFGYPDLNVSNVSCGTKIG